MSIHQKKDDHENYNFFQHQSIDGAPLKTTQQPPQLKRNRTSLDITTQLLNSEIETKQFMDLQKNENNEKSPFKRLKKNTSSSSWYFCMFTTTSLINESEPENPNDKLIELRKKINNIPKRQRQKSQIIAPLARECVRIFRNKLETKTTLDKDTIDEIVPSKYIVPESEILCSRPNRTFLGVSRQPWVDLQFLNQFGSCTTSASNTIGTGNTFHKNNNTDDENKSRKKNRGQYAEFDIALLVSGFGPNRKAAELFSSILNNKSRGKIPRLAFGTLLATKWQFEFYGSIDAVFDARFEYFTIQSKDYELIIQPKNTDQENENINISM